VVCMAVCVGCLCQLEAQLINDLKVTLHLGKLGHMRQAATNTARSRKISPYNLEHALT
jgi:hypothetical protein